MPRRKHEINAAQAAIKHLRPPRRLPWPYLTRTRTGAAGTGEIASPRPFHEGHYVPQRSSLTGSRNGRRQLAGQHVQMIVGIA
jgi:hypothetical protein